MNSLWILRRVFYTRCAVALVVVLLAAGCKARAQWTAADADTAFNDYNNNFYFDETGSDYGYRVQQGSTTPTSFWMAAEQIEMVVDAYNQSGSSTYENMIPQVINGFAYEHPSWWSGSDLYDDDMLWATIAWIKAYQVIGNTNWLSQAETAFQTVYNRGRASNGGIYWYAGCESSCSSWYENSPANWTFVIAGIMLYNATGNSTYLSEANGVFNWAYANLYKSSTGEIYDGVNSSGTSTNQYSYNYGIAIGALYWEGYWSDATNVAGYEMNGMGNYSGTRNGYNILADGDASENGSDGGGFAGIALRWTSFAYTNDAISNSNVLPWMQANVDQAWADRNSSDLIWANWETSTASSGLYSWDCSSGVVGMLDVTP